jgi:RNA polymerase sigma-70 factor, ECF subfamily
MLLDRGERDFERWVRAYSAELYRYAYWLCRDRFVAEDLLQETFARAWQATEQLRDAQAVKSWLYTILRNEHARLYERKRFDIDEGQDLGEIIDSTAGDPADGIALRESLRRLPVAYREPLLLQVLGGFTCAEIAAMLNLTAGAVMTRLTRARMALSGRRERAAAAAGARR